MMHICGTFQKLWDERFDLLRRTWTHCLADGGKGKANIRLTPPPAYTVDINLAYY